MFWCLNILCRGNAIHDFGDPLQQATSEACRSSDAMSKGAVGRPKWDDPTATTTSRKQACSGSARNAGEFLGYLSEPIQTFDELRRCLDRSNVILSAGTDYPVFSGNSLAPSTAANLVDRPDPSVEAAFSEMVYTTGEVERIVRLAGKAAPGRRMQSDLSRQSKCPRSITSLWRQVERSPCEA